MTGKTVKVLKIKIQKVTNDEKKEHYCSGDIKGKKTCKNPVKFRWSGGFYFCKGCHYNELEEYETDEEDSSSEEESSSSEEEDSSEEESSDEDYSDYTSDYSSSDSDY